MIEENVYRKMESLLNGMFKAGADVSAGLLEFLKEWNKTQKEDKLLKNGVGETSLRNLLKGLKEGDQLKAMVIPDEEYDEFIKVLKNTKIKNFSSLDLSSDNCRTILFAESDTKEIVNALEAFSAQRNLQTEVDPEVFYLAAKESKITAIENIDEVELELLRYNARKNPFPYTVVDINGKPSILARSEDFEKVDTSLNRIASSLAGEQGSLIRKQIEYKIKGRQEVNIAIEDAEKESIIIDKKNPNNYIMITADDFVYYKSNKELTAISRKEPGAVDAVYQKLEGLTEPVVISKNEFELSYAERKAILDKKTAVYPVGYSAVDEDIEKMNQEATVDAINNYRSKFVITEVDNDERSLDSILEKVESKNNTEIEKGNSRDEQDR